MDFYFYYKFKITFKDYLDFVTKSFLLNIVFALFIKILTKLNNIYLYYKNLKLNYIMICILLFILLFDTFYIFPSDIIFSFFFLNFSIFNILNKSLDYLIDASLKEHNMTNELTLFMVFPLIPIKYNQKVPVRYVGGSARLGFEVLKKADTAIVAAAIAGVAAVTTGLIHTTNESYNRELDREHDRVKRQKDRDNLLKIELEKKKMELESIQSNKNQQQINKKTNEILLNKDNTKKI